MSTPFDCPFHFSWTELLRYRTDSDVKLNCIVSFVCVYIFVLVFFVCYCNSVKPVSGTLSQKRKVLLQRTMVYLWWKMSPLTCCVLPHPGPDCEPDQADPAADWPADEGEWSGPAGHWSHSQWLAAGDWQHAPRLLYHQQQWGLFLLLLWEADLSLMGKYTCLFQKR